MFQISLNWCLERCRAHFLTAARPFIETKESFYRYRFLPLQWTLPEQIKNTIRFWLRSDFEYKFHVFNTQTMYPIPKFQLIWDTIKVSINFADLNWFCVILGICKDRFCLNDAKWVGCCNLHMCNKCGSTQELTFIHQDFFLCVTCLSVEKH